MPAEPLDRVDALIIGAGVVGLAVARELAMRGREVIVVEAENAIGTQTSSRHSEVIHAGIYYRHGSLKAQCCVRGRELLYPYCESHQVGHRRCGKLIVATDAAQQETLASLRERAIANGVDDLQWLTAREVAAIEPALQCTAALLSPSTGIIDSHALMLALLGDAQTGGAMLALQSRVVSVRRGSSLNEVTVLSGDDEFIIAAPLVVNCAGHDALALARDTEQAASVKPHANDQPGHDPAPLPDPAPLAKGNYFRLTGRAPCTRLIYPVPEPGGLGVHLTLDLAGQARFGPDVQWVEHVDYSVDPGRAAHFYEAIRRYWPQLRDDQLVPDYAGIRPKICVDGQLADDFVIDVRSGLSGARLIQLFGIESPGLTSSLALAERVASLSD